MPSPKSRSKVAGNGDRLTAEFTSGQLVVAICVSLFFALTCFLLGVLVGKYDSASQGADTAAVSDTESSPKEPEAASAPREDEQKRREGTQTTPRANLLIRKPASATPDRRETPGDARERELASLPPRLERPAQAAAPARITKPAGEQGPVRLSALPPGSPEAPGATTPQEPFPDKLPAPKAPAPSESKPETRPPEQKTEAPPTPAPSPEAAAAPKPPSAPEPPKPAATPEKPSGTKPESKDRGQFGIQVASFQGAQRKTEAAVYKRRLKENAGIDSEIIRSEDDQYYRIVIVGYKDRATAAAACAELKKRAGFADAWVRAL